MKLKKILDRLLDTRIVQKEEKFRNRLKNTSQNNIPLPSPKLTASELLGKEKPGKMH